MTHKTGNAASPPTNCSADNKAGSAAYTGDVARLAALLWADPSLLSATDSVAGRTVLHWAVAGAQLAAVKYIIGRWNGDVLLAIKDSAGGDTPLHLFCGPHGIMQLLYAGGSFTPPLDARNTKNETPVDAIAASICISTAEAQAAMDDLLSNNSTAHSSRAAQKIFSFMRRSPARVPPMRHRPVLCARALTMRGCLMSAAPYVVVLSFVCAPSLRAAAAMGSALAVATTLACYSYGGPSHFGTAIYKAYFTSEPRVALVVCLALVLLLSIQNALCLSHAWEEAPRLAALHCLCQLLTLASYASVLVSDPGFIPGGADADHESYWLAAEAPKAISSASQGAETQDEEAQGGDAASSRADTHMTATFCPRCELERIPRARFSPFCMGMVRIFDHDCVYLGVSIGAGNHRSFLLFLCSALVSIAAGVGFAVKRPPSMGAPSSIPSRLFAFGVVFAICVVPPLCFLIVQQHRLVLSNVTLVEELRWIRLHPGADTPRTRTTQGWNDYAPHDTGSSVGNFLAFWRAERRAMDGKRTD